MFYCQENNPQNEIKIAFLKVKVLIKPCVKTKPNL